MRDPRTINPAVPLLLSLALVAGLFIGHGMRREHMPLPALFVARGTSPSDKVDQVLDLIDRQYVDTVAKTQLVEEVIQDLLQRLDPHSYYISAAELRAAQEPLEGSFEGIGVEFAIQHDTVVVIAPVEGGPSAALGIRAGDRIVSADGVPMTGMDITNEQVMERLRGPGGSSVTVSIVRKGQARPFEVTIQRGKIPITSVAASLLRPDGTGYIKLVRFARTTHQEFVDAARSLQKAGMKRLVLDLRGNGGGYLNAAIELADEFLPEGRMIVYTQGRSHPRQDYRATRNGLLETMPLAVLIDEGSASASEILAGAVQDNDRGTIVGRRSFGKGLVQEHLDLPDHSAVRLTTARYYTPSGRSIQRPYGEGIDYADDLAERFDHGEMLHADSAQVDSTQVFRTMGGRIVYGGGGITPDLFVAADTAGTTRFLNELFFSGSLNQFAFDVVDRDRARFEAFGDPLVFRDRFRMDDRLWADLLAHAAREGIADRPAERTRSAQAIEQRLKAGIARNVWGNEGFYRILLDSDSIFLKADEQLRTGG